MSIQNKCLGCGTLKQTTNKDEVGYALDLSHDYCYDCFQLINYGKNKNHYHPNNYLEIKENSVIFIIQSVMQLDLMFSLPITRIQPNAKYVYIINQLDLLPRDTNLDLLIENITIQGKKNKIKFEDIILMSAVNKNDIFNLKDYILSYKEKDIYLFGFQNSGKTTILKALTNNDKALNINKSGLTQEIITEDFEGKVLHDMPGTYTTGYLADYLPFEEYRKMLPSKTLKPKVYQLKNTQKLIINDLIEISFTGLDSTTLVLYLNNFNKIEKYNIKNENEYLNNKFEYITKTFKTFNEKTQITIADLVLVHTSEAINIKVRLPKNMHLTMIEAIFK